MALLPFFRRDQTDLPPDWDLSPWRNLDKTIGDFSSAPGFPAHFRSHVGGILRDMDNSIARMDEEMRRVMMAAPGGAYNGPPGSLLSDLTHNISPSISTSSNGQQIAHYDFDVKGFRPEEITVKTQDNLLEVIARHEERSPGREISREFKRTFTIPEGISPDELQGKLVQDGILRVEAPYRPPSALTSSSSEGSYSYHPIPITHQY
ncbi:hypothetical protein BV898_16197 [Hypsibius exemplaris]|uniref:SHSP domain-containing protein n=1 Tax=Hypsibius exemplaris TaxID=2072580 RepID=A0A9X6RL87_HYPEX|nr:hypothetical protein BV898_16197 [Hypsibius exemplaris]